MNISWAIVPLTTPLERNQMIASRNLQEDLIGKLMKYER